MPRTPPSSSGSPFSEANHMQPPAPPSAKSRSRRTLSHHDRSKSENFDDRRSFSFFRRSMSAKCSPQLPQWPAAQREVMINDMVGNGVSGMLHMWINYGRGWQPRWFVLVDGVLSYYKIKGSDTIVLNREDETGSLHIGLESFRRVDSHRARSSDNKPVGEVHLMVCSIDEWEADDRRFSIHTGTKKRLQLRAESREDKAAWLKALHAVKDMFPRVSNEETMAPVESVVISTKKLRQRLLEEGLSEATIQDSERIMRNELIKMHKQTVVLKNQNMQLLDRLRHLETDKVDLENTLVHESQRQSKKHGDRLTHEKHSEGSASDSCDELDRHDHSDDLDRHDHSDDDHDAFFDSSDFLLPSFDENNGSDLLEVFLDSGHEETPNGENNENLTIGPVGSNYPHIKRRKKLPDPVEKEKGVSLWSVIKDNVGKDLSKVCLPVYFNEPLSLLQKCFEDLEYSYLLDRAYVWGKMGNNLRRMLYVSAFAVSGYACTAGRTCKPFNPLLGETYEADYPDKGIRFISEKVSHHPMVVACHCEGNGWKFWGDINVKSKFWGRSIQIDPVGLLNLEFDDGEVFQWSKVTTSIYNLILGKFYCDHYGTMRIEGNRDYSCKIKFKEQSIINRHPHQVCGVVEDKKGKTAATLCGKWDEGLHYVIGDNSGKRKRSIISSRRIWKRSEPSEHQTRHNLTQFAITLNEITPGLREKLPPTDSRLRPDQRYLENGLNGVANAEKLRLEQRQRQARKMQQDWKPRWFVKDKGSETYRYIGGYWEAREKGIWESCPHIFEDLPTDTDFN